MLHFNRPACVKPLCSFRCRCSASFSSCLLLTHDTHYVPGVLPAHRRSEEAPSGICISGRRGLSVIGKYGHAYKRSRFDSNGLITGTQNGIFQRPSDWAGAGPGARPGADPGPDPGADPAARPGVEGWAQVSMVSQAPEEAPTNQLLPDLQSPFLGSGFMDGRLGSKPLVPEEWRPKGQH